MVDKIEKLCELLENDIIAKELQNISAEEATKILSKNGLSITVEELIELRDYVMGDKELSADELEMISGGKLFKKGEYRKLFRATVNGFLAGLKLW